MEKFCLSGITTKERFLHKNLHLDITIKKLIIQKLWFTPIQFNKEAFWQNPHLKLLWSISDGHSIIFKKNGSFPSTSTDKFSIKSLIETILKRQLSLQN